ncbi:DUF2955 domain-containing protein [Vibrio aestuarianus]|uniref:DUF2955 domain-containing protein n=1 Tax=Vibrio aestuarianus TaxID=28171 RepID=UPI0021C28DF1|nr:DUF2955 domain-containing protein [Vibrio aestuarianus]MDE1317544.1 DUF2955 domain-containing protein [Vibrio aestuarianus]CAH8189678.1 Permease of the drug/metabolite transporter (DMT) superfamily [Vibrio aestuarianus]
MFHSAANPIIRLVFAPILLLFYLQFSGAAMPMLAPIFVVIFLTIMPSKPPVSLLLKLLLVMFFISFIVVNLGEILVDTPTGFALFCWALLFLSYYRSHRDPKDILSTLTLMVVIIMAVMTKQMGVSASVLPWLMFEALIIAIVVTSLSFLIFPGDEQDIQPDEQSQEKTSAHITLIIFKATAMSLVLAALIGTGSSQSILIAITISSMIKTPIQHEQKTFSHNRLITTTVGILFTVPVMLLFMFNVPTWVVLGVALFCGIQLACYAIRCNCRLSIYQLLFTNFTVLTYQIIKNQGTDSMSAELTRLVSIVIAIFIGALILNVGKSVDSRVSAKS